MEWPGPLVRPRPRRCELCGCGRAWQHVRFAPKSTSERSARNEKRSAEVECSVRPYLATLGIVKVLLPPRQSRGSPCVTSVAHYLSYSCEARAEVRPRLVGERTVRFWRDCRGSLQPRLRMR